MIYKLKNKLKSTKLGKKLISCIVKTKLFVIMYKTLDILCLTDAAYKRRVINKHCNFFYQNKDRILRIISNFADEQSKNTYTQIIQYRCSEDKKYLSIYSKEEQYFPKDIISFTEEEVFVDCGSYDGDTISQFLKKCKEKYKKIIAFDADMTNLSKIENKKIKNIVLFNLAVWDKEDKLPFLQDSTECSKLKETKCDTTLFANKVEKKLVNCNKMDDIDECKDMTFLKMDIEGAELKALKGAEKIIRKNKPKLAICIYHSDEDMLDIPEWIINLNMNYKIYIRHHSNCIIDTILYAI